MRDRLIRTGSVLILLFAVMPSVTFVGHGPVQAAHTHAPGNPSGPVPIQGDSGSDHASHCHQGMSKCGGQQSMVGTWWVGEGGGMPVLDDPWLPSSGYDEVQYLHDPLTKILQPPRSSV